MGGCLPSTQLTQVWSVAPYRVTFLSSPGVIASLVVGTLTLQKRRKLLREYLDFLIISWEIISTPKDLYRGRSS